MHVKILQKNDVKAADLQMLKCKKRKIIIKLTVNNGHVMFGGEICYY